MKYEFRKDEVNGKFLIAQDENFQYQTYLHQYEINVMQFDKISGDLVKVFFCDMFDTSKIEEIAPSYSELALLL